MFENQNEVCKIWLKQLSEYMEYCEIDDMPIDDVRKELHGFGADVEGFHTKLKGILNKKKNSLNAEGLIEHLIEWIVPKTDLIWTGKPVTATGIAKEEAVFFKDNRKIITSSFEWKGEDRNNPAYIKVSWKAYITEKCELWVNFVNRDTKESLCQISLGYDKAGNKKLTDFGFDPTKIKWDPCIGIKK